MEERKWKLIGGVEANKAPLIVIDAYGNELFRITFSVPPMGTSAGAAIGRVFPTMVQEIIKKDGSVDIDAVKIVFTHELDYNNQLVKI